METQPRHLRNLDSRFHGLTPIKCKELAFEYADKNKAHLIIPTGWVRNKAAGWLRNFMTRHHLSTRAPEATSIARRMCVQQTRYELVFHQLKRNI